MAKRAQPVTPVQMTGWIMILLVVLAIFGPLGAVLYRAEGFSDLRPADWAAVRFTLLQAALSAALSCLVAIPVARALARRRFRGRGAYISLMGAPFILPVIVAVMGLLAIFGRAGWLNTALEGIGAGQIEIYGLAGVVLAHVFLNLPLATRLILQAWLAVPSERIRLAHSLNFTARDMRRHFVWPLLRAALPGAAMVIFLICTTSFAVALILGGGPSATTIELAIYQAFRFDFDLGRAALLGVIQVAICVGAGLVAWRFATAAEFGGGLDRPAMAWPGDSKGARFADRAALILAGAFLLLPLAAVTGEGIGAVAGLPLSTWEAALRSILLALASTALAVSLALPIALLIAGKSGRAGLEAVGLLSIAVSPLVIGTGLFLIVFPVVNPVALSLPITGLVNALVALPFLLRALVPAARQAEATQGRLADALGMQGFARSRHAILPRLRRPLGFGAGLAAAFSMGDLGVIALFSAQGQETLPLEMYRLFGSYRTNDAQGAAVLLMALSLGMFWLFDRGGRVNAAT
ncbi:thiamine/thiamine pyrophosphate ABC transporter permease ThiP [Jannaschia sp. J12C1-MA-4]|uniref:Thiamine/thiamine pyrophosphate ABC transporter permease ThiP n=1 Tax=Gymnodinialimonas ceratoperidinii TaxID=2856823 RepID=A0A8F6TY67_9RHOB|nr:thiamine/thiamine pyrophosphate ABC transporter permease ThiP [Gymnodinialimonas ceratoperidinii]